MGRKLLCLISAVAFATAVFGCSKPAASSTPEEGSSGGQVAVTVTIDGSAGETTGLQVSGTQSVMESGGLTAMEALTLAAGQLGYSVERNGDYVTAIGGLREKAAGAGSGWMYEVNGNCPPKAASAYDLADGDRLTWIYVK